MGPDELHDLWRSQNGPRELTIDSDVLLKQVRRNASSFAAMVSSRDVCDVGGALVMAGVCCYLAAWGIPSIELSLWPLWLLAAAYLWFACFIVIDRILRRKSPAALGEPVVVCIEHALRQVDHQIWLLRRAWWFVLPLAAGHWVFLGYLVWLARTFLWDGLPYLIPPGILFAVFPPWVLWLNLRCVKRDLLPRRQELQELLDELCSTHQPV